jgi:O-antigen/teichoic acid export membrane protein
VTPTARTDGAAAVPAVRGGAGEVLVVARGSGELAAGNFFEFAARFAIAFILARSLGAGGYGLYVLAISAATLFSGISLLGLDDAMTRYVAIASGRRDAPAVRGTVQVGLAAATASGVLFGAVLYAGADPIATGLFNEPQLARLLQLVALAVPFLSVSNVLAGTARGFRRMDIAALSENVVQSVVRLGLLTVFFLLSGLSTATAVVVFGISDVAATVTMVTLLGRQFPLAPQGQPVRRDVKGVFRFALPLWFSGMLRRFRGNLVALLLGATGPAANVGVFAVVNKINLVGHVWVLSIFMAVKPTMAQLHDRGDRAGLARVYTSTTRWSLSLGLPFVIAMVLYREPILATFGTSFSAGSTALVILAMAELANAGTGTCQSMIDMTGHTRLKVANAVLWTGLLIGSASLLIPRWGVVGAATASLIAIATVNLLSVAEVWALEHVVPFDRAFWKPLAAAGGALTTGLVLGWLMPVGADLALASLQGIVVVGVFAGLIGLFGLSAEDRLVLDRIRDGVARRARPTLRRRPTTVAPAGRRRRGAPRAGVGTDRGSVAGPVYIGGLDRSGKTTLAAFLTSHPNLDIPDAGSNLWTYFYGRFGDLAQPRNLERCIDMMQRYRHVAILQPDPHRIRHEFSAGPPTYARLFSLVHAHHAERQGKPRWGTQTGLIERYADEVFAAYPGVRIVHMVRDPRDRYEASRALWPGGKGQAGGATARWVYSTRLAQRHARRHPGGYLIVRFEDLVQRTEETLRVVCDFLGETFEPDMLGMPAAPERRARLASRSPARSKTPTTPTTTAVLPTAPVVPAACAPQTPLSTAFIGRFRECVSAEDVAFIQFHAGRLMPAYGYPLVPLTWGTREWARFFTRTWPRQAARMLAWRSREALQQRLPARAGRTPDPRLVDPLPEAVR